MFTEEMLKELDEWFTAAVEKIFGIERKNDVECIIPEPVRYFRGGADIGVDINYTVGEDEYGWGRSFDPSNQEQKALVKKIKVRFDIFRKKRKLSYLSISVWCKPYHNTAFKMFEK